MKTLDFANDFIVIFFVLYITDNFSKISILFVYFCCIGAGFPSPFPIFNL